ncbi:2-methylisocitrate lyase, mitochondrial [Elsinoe australis]|uniref:2-methylisocitrate lyase, mitochondrial n=1 Tax=Elsinoe australis TaxID=40998 RepID=A0A2P8A6F9_9PEZI|nr:2-methylisocitrate lyase, mitochondrial [Elsinoe australis]
MATQPPGRTYTPAAARLRQLLAESTAPLTLPGVYDGLTARIALNVGFQALYMTGAGTAASTLGQPDLGILGLADMLRNASMIASLDPSVPVIADADTGFGGPLNVARTVRGYIDAGVAGLHLEDQVANKRCGHLGGKELVSREEFWVRIRAAVRARRESRRDIVVVARTDALQGQGFEEAVERLKGAVREGADVAFLEGVRTEEEGRKFCEAMGSTPCFLNVVAGGVTPNFSKEDAHRMGYKIVIWPIVALTEAYVGVERAMKELKGSGQVATREDGKGGIRDIFGICGLDKCREFDEAVGGISYKNGV